MKHLKPTLRILIIVLLSTTSCQFNSQQTPSPNEVSIDLQEDIDQLIALYNAQEMPEYLWERNPALTGNEFDINEIFGILDHIHTVGGMNWHTFIKLLILVPGRRLYMPNKPVTSHF